MQHEEKRAACRLLFQYAGDIIIGVASMDDQRQARLPRRGDVGAEATLLIGPLAVVVMIIEAGLADAHHLRMACEFHDLFERDVLLLRRVMRMSADRAEYVTMRLDDLKQIGESPHPGGDGEHEADPCALGAREHGLALRGEIGKIEMAVTIDQHRKTKP